METFPPFLEPIVEVSSPSAAAASRNSTGSVRSEESVASAAELLEAKSGGGGGGDSGATNDDVGNSMEQQAQNYRHELIETKEGLLGSSASTCNSGDDNDDNNKDSIATIANNKEMFADRINGGCTATNDDNSSDISRASKRILSPQKPKNPSQLQQHLLSSDSPVPKKQRSSDDPQQTERSMTDRGVDSTIDEAGIDEAGIDDRNRSCNKTTTLDASNTEGTNIDSIDGSRNSSAVKRSVPSKSCSSSKHQERSPSCRSPKAKKLCQPESNKRIVQSDSDSVASSSIEEDRQSDASRESLSRNLLGELSKSSRSRNNNNNSAMDDDEKDKLNRDPTTKIVRTDGPTTNDGNNEIFGAGEVSTRANGSGEVSTRKLGTTTPGKHPSATESGTDVDSDATAIAHLSTSSGKYHDNSRTKGIV